MITPGPWKWTSESENNELVDLVSATDGTAVLSSSGAYGYESAIAVSDDNAQAIAALPLLIEALEAVEWIDDTYIDPDRPPEDSLVCPFCEHIKPYGHSQECRLAQALAAAKGETNG
jgi:hypothetical protein